MAKKKRRQRSNRPITPLILIAAGVVLLIAALAWGLNTSLGENAQNGGTGSTTVQGPNPEIPRASLAEAKAAHDAGNAVFVDVRANDIFTGSHIPGALSIPENEVPQRLDELDKDAWIITYCT